MSVQTVRFLEHENEVPDHIKYYKLWSEDFERCGGWYFFITNTKTPEHIYVFKIDFIPMMKALMEYKPMQSVL